MKKKMILIMAALTLTTVSLWGCGSEKSTKNNSEKSEKKVYQIATDNAFAPFTYTDENGNYIGIDIDIFNAIAEDQNIEFEYQHLGFEGSCAAIETSKADGAMCCLSIKEERKEKYDFSDPYYKSSVVVVVRNNSEINEFADLKGKKIAAKIGTDGERYAADLAEQFDAVSQPVEDFSTEFMMLKSGNVDAIIEDITVTKMALADDDTCKIIGEEGYAADIGFAVSKGKNQELLEKFNTGLKNIKANSKYDEIMSKYLD